ncbi:hypothetical protein CEUSTIGMA_g9024.t1 [Chlamydomonas eustigma]|uniref:UDP-3-O-acyl-N-acetylglucosamine deacetylase n=1 Tax=Chlamydomonas eustigma TaxID=1157962 RepID=A0A250XEY8_9CHLO|nr:hypothetical protein CEUSTIGMA_g9024.t1 [Chlamydomonas eustigma]|eukprot:GAX81596.1 hypothetical protein CEUSTIGMA_g9024.t1 [Chlamydomonas eustigma]
MQFPTRNLPSYVGQASTSGRIHVPRATFYTRHHLRRRQAHNININNQNPKEIRPLHIAFATDVDDAVEGSKMTDVGSNNALPIDKSDEVIEEGAPDLPKPGIFQQTLIQSFTTGGIGLHSGEYAHVRVRPAFAGEGRYFVQVPKGTNSHLFKPAGPEVNTLDELSSGIESDTELEALKLNMFQMFLEDQEKSGFEGNFMQWLEYVDIADKQRVLYSMGPSALKTEFFHGGKERIQARGVEEKVWMASVDSLTDGVIVTRRLVNSEGEILMGVELLLSALELCGVENARIEIEGGLEVPVLDGSALGWVLHIQFAGLRNAPTESTQLSEEDEYALAMMEDVDVVEDNEGEELEESEQQDSSALRMTPRKLLCPSEPILVRDGDAFIQLIPENTSRITVGIDHHEFAEIIGKQWFSWSMFEDTHFRFELADARMYVEAPDEAVALREMGYMKGGTEGCVLIAHGDRWWDPNLVRHVYNEPVRHAMVELLGDLALNAKDGHSGIPIGHIVAYKPNHHLNGLFLKALREKTSDVDWVVAASLVVSEEQQEEYVEEEGNYYGEGEEGMVNDEYAEEGEEGMEEENRPSK